MKRTAGTELIVTSKRAALFQRDLIRARAAHTKAVSSGYNFENRLSRPGQGWGAGNALTTDGLSWTQEFEIYLKGCRKPQKGRDPENIKRTM